MRTLYHRSGVLFWLACANAALYALFMIADIGGFRYSFGPLFGAAGGSAASLWISTKLLKYASVCVCFVLSVCVMRSVPQDGNERGYRETQTEKNAGGSTYRRDARLQAVVFAFTLAADFLILFTPHYTTGILVFCGAHLTATYRYAGAQGARKAAIIAGVSAATLILFVALYSHFSQLSFDAELDANNYIPYAEEVSSAMPYIVSEIIAWSGAIAAAPYTLLIVSATIAAYRRRQARANNILSRLGMTLFLLCDVNVLLWNLQRVADMTAIPAWTGTLIWTFYLPAQTMLALSAYDFAKWQKPLSSPL